MRLHPTAGAGILENKGPSGGSAGRPVLSRLRDDASRRNTLVVRKLDRLGRSLRDLITMLHDPRPQAVKFHSTRRETDLAQAKPIVS
jgi:DNA invertase Pin-like site-specific DNA recombinase